MQKLKHEAHYSHDQRFDRTGQVSAFFRLSSLFSYAFKKSEDNTDENIKNLESFKQHTMDVI